METVMKTAFALLLATVTLTACGVQRLPVALPGGMAQISAQQAGTPTVKEPPALTKGMKLHYDTMTVTAGKKVAATHEQLIASVSPTEVLITHTVPGPNGSPTSFMETVKLGKVLVSSRWTPEPPLMTDIDPDLGQPGTLKVKAGTFRVKKVLLHANGITETWWFSGAVPVKLNVKGLNAGKSEFTAELAVY
jgi:hypothetical protein